MPYRLEVRQIRKTYPGVVALDDVSLGVNDGEVLAVIGENGAGKSTLMKIMAGIVEPDEGMILLDERQVSFANPSEAIRSGVSLIHQELNLHENLSVAENLFLGREPSRYGWLDRGEMFRRSEGYLEQVGLPIAPRTSLSQLNTASRQLVEVAKAISTDARVIIMDEPTSSLSIQETQRLFDVVGRLRRSGVSVIYISHRLAEVQELADRVEVLRDGCPAGSLSRKDASHDAMVSAMVGRDLSQLYQRKRTEGISHDAATALEVRDLTIARSNHTSPPPAKIDFEVRAGEIVGIAGLVGSGRTELVETLFGVRTPVATANTTTGSVTASGRRVRPGDLRDAMKAGIGLVPEDRKQTGLLIHSSVRDNATVASITDHHSYPRLDFQWEHSKTAELIDQLSVKTASQSTVIGTLSGGNQQKVALGKWLMRDPSVLLLDEPTRGVDIGAKQEIYGLLDRLAAEGLAILFVSSEMEEVIALSDRVLVMKDFAVAGELRGPEITEECIMRLAVAPTTADAEGRTP